MSERDFYEILHVSRDAPEQIIRASYRTLMQQLKRHPDLGGDPAAAALINEAYATLTNASKRAQYDQSLAQVARQGAGSVQVPELRPFDACVFCEQGHDYGRVIPHDARCSRCASPLSVVDGPRLEGRDARAVARIQKHQTVELITEWPPRETISGRTLDVSLTGIRLLTRQKFASGQLLRLRSADLETVARITNTSVQKTGWRADHEAGLAFVTLLFTKSVGAFVSRKV